MTLRISRSGIVYLQHIWNVQKNWVQVSHKLKLTRQILFKESKEKKEHEKVDDRISSSSSHIFVECLPFQLTQVSKQKPKRKNSVPLKCLPTSLANLLSQAR